jgi:hypothetical protein
MWIDWVDRKNIQDFGEETWKTNKETVEQLSLKWTVRRWVVRVDGS